MDGGGTTACIILAGGRGERAKPITLESADYIRSKALIPFAGRRLVEWVVDACREQGITRFYVVAQGLENRSQIKLLLGHGERYGVEIRYSRARYDSYNVGSGAATLHNLEQWQLDDRALVVPVDCLYDFSLQGLAATQRATGALVTVATVERSPREVAGKYGALRTDQAGLVREFTEKPDAARLRRLFPELAEETRGIPTNAGMYLVDCGRLRRAARDPELMRRAHQRLDWGSDLLPWLVRHSLPVAAHRIDRMGDLGSVQDYLGTLREALSGCYTQFNRQMAAPTSERPRYWIDESSLRTRDDRSGTTLAQKLAEGSVVIGEGVRIGRDVEIGRGVRLEHADIGDGVDLHEGVRITRAACGDSVVVGPYAEISDSYLGPMAEVRSERAKPVRLERFTALGDGAHLWPGSRLAGISVYPRLRVPTIRGVPAGTRLTSSEDILQWI